MSDNIKEPRKEYTERAGGLQLNRLAIKGGRAVRAAGVEGLPPLPSMIDASGALTVNGAKKYKTYLANAEFMGFSGQTVTGLKGLINSKPAVPVIPSAIEFIKDDVDGASTSLTDFASICLDDVYPSLWSLLLMTAPETTGGNSKLDDESNNVRPYMKHYSQESIINWHQETIRNKTQFTMLVLKESVTKREGFKVESEDQYRLLELINGIYHQATYDKDGNIKTELEPVTINGKQLEEIPCELITMGRSVIDALVDANYRHYKIYAEYGSKLHTNAFPVLWEVGVEGDETSKNVNIGPGVKWNAPQGSSFGVLETNSTMDSHDKALANTEYIMSTLGADMLRPTGSNESGEAKRMDKVATNSVNADVANTVSAAITKMLKRICDVLGVTGECSYQLNTDFEPSKLDPNALNAYVAAWHGKAISRKTLHENLQKGEIMSSERTIEEEEALILAEQETEFTPNLDGPIEE